VGEKNIELIPVKQIEAITGYIKGGCSPVGMKKAFVTTFDSSAESLERIIFSAGKPGLQVEISPSDIQKAVRSSFADICE
jgi:Cys-tRNA(Pro)/Cys-tRNA(Cys) deacylase